MEKKYKVEHCYPDGSVSVYLAAVPVKPFQTEAEATHHTVMWARQLAEDGLRGFVRCDVLSEPLGFHLEVQLDNVAATHDLFDDLPPEEALGEGNYEEVDRIAHFLWPDDGSDRLDGPFAFTLSNGVKVQVSNPSRVVQVSSSSRRGSACVVVFMKDDNSVRAFCQGPSLREMMVRFGLTESEARDAWEQVVYRMTLLELACR